MFKPSLAINKRMNRNKNERKVISRTYIIKQFQSYPECYNKTSQINKLADMSK